jgi:hypothetical protein
MTQARAILIGLMALALAAYASQFFIDFSSGNLAAASIVLASSLTVLLYILWTSAIQTHPLSTFAIFGFCFTTQLGALLLQSASWTSLTANLRQPLETFLTLALYQGVALLAHALYRLFSEPGAQRASGLVRSALEKVNLYVTPTAGTLWIMGMIGLSSFLFSGGQGVGGKIAHGITFVAWAPFLIPMFVMQQGDSYCNARKNYFFLALYAGGIVLLGIAVNARGLMLAGVMTISLFFLLRAMRSTARVTTAQVAKLSVLALLLVAFSIPVADLATAMVLARKSRDNVSTMKLIEETVYYLQQPQMLRAQRERDKFVSLQSNYDESYFASPLMARLIETKFHDNALFFSTRIPLQDEEKLREITGDFLWATLPEPILKSLEIDVDKQDLRFSMGDYISFLGGGGEVGGFKTGSGFAQGIVIFGHFFPLVYFLMCPILFMALDLLAYRSMQGSVLVSSLGMLGIWRMFQYGISGESLQYLFMAVVRGLPQNIVLFLLIFYFARMAARMLGTLTGMNRPAPKLAAL